MSTFSYNDASGLRRVWNRLKTGLYLRVGPATLQLRARRTVRGSSVAIRTMSTSTLLRDDIVHRREAAALSLRGNHEVAERALEALDERQRSSCAHQAGVALIVGAGPGVGTALARRFAAAGMSVALAARRVERLSGLIEELGAQGRKASAYPCDAAEERSVARLFETTRADFGDPNLVVYNCEAFGPGGILETNPHAFEDCWRVNCFGAFLVARQALPGMVSRGSGTIVFTGPTGSLRGRAGFVNLAVGKSGARMLAQSMAREFGPKGVHVAHIVLDGPILTPMNHDVVEERGVEGLMDPDAIADTILQIHRQPKTTWTHELDLRPFVEPF